MYSIKIHILQGHVNALKALVSDCDKTDDETLRRKQEISVRRSYQTRRYRLNIVVLQPCKG